MTPAVDSMFSNAEIVAAIKAQLAGIWLDDDDHSKGKAFERVELFDEESLTEAFRLLIVSEQRICIIVALSEQFEPVIDGLKILVTRMLPVGLMISDRRMGDRVKALWGDAEDATVPGAFALVKLALPNVTGQILDAAGGNENIVATPQHSEPIFLKDTDKQDLPGRAAVLLEIHCRGGTLEARTGPGETV